MKPFGYTFTCDLCGGNWITQTIILEERSPISKLNVVRCNDHLVISPHTFLDTTYSEVKGSKLQYVCGECDHELTEEDIFKLTFDNNL